MIKKGHARPRKSDPQLLLFLNLLNKVVEKWSREANVIREAARQEHIKNQPWNKNNTNSSGSEFGNYKCKKANPKSPLRFRMDKSIKFIFDRKLSLGELYMKQVLENWFFKVTDIRRTLLKLVCIDVDTQVCTLY